jgi:tRNA(His) 5'-end guanylyltransferase
MKKPYDEDFINIMNKTCMFLCEEIQGVQMGYVQSDEISLLITDFDKISTDLWFDGNIQKIASVSASMATACFNNLFLQKTLKNTDGDPKIIISQSSFAFFDARVFTISDPTEVENYFIWRQKDAVRNSISMTAQSLYSHKQLDGKSQSDMQEMIHAVGHNWNDMPDGFKRGRTFYNEEICRPYNHGDMEMKEWVLRTPDFLKEREKLSEFIPKYK